MVSTKKTQTISIDIDVYNKHQKLGNNISSICNEALWTFLGKDPKTKAEILKKKLLEKEAKINEKVVEIEHAQIIQDFEVTEAEQIKAELERQQAAELAVRAAEQRRLDELQELKTLNAKIEDYVLVFRDVYNACVRELHEKHKPNRFDYLTKIKDAKELLELIKAVTEKKKAET